jgi:beta-glucosidase-like glycosyl hydrolase
MVGHIVVPFLDAYLPASLSHSVVTGLIREEWGFSGLITTDALDMRAITDRWSSADAAVRAFTAGCDVILMPEDPHAAIDAIADAIANGAVDEELLVAADERWEGARAYAGLRSRQTPAYASREPVIVDQATHAMIALKAADVAIRTEGDAELLPLTKWPHVAAFAVIDEADADAATTWFSSLAQATEVNCRRGSARAHRGHHGCGLPRLCLLW